jgi:6-phosphogluconolactonase
MPAPHEIRILENESAWAEGVAGFLVGTIEATLRCKPRVRLVLSGGSTPRRLYHTLAQPEWAKRIDWTSVVLFFGDERCVPPTHPDSNYGMAKEALIDPLQIASQHVMRMHGEVEPEEAAFHYETTIREAFAPGQTPFPRFDLIFLGLGDDGHTASLFPSSPALHEQRRLVVATLSPIGISHRLTMTLPLLNAAETVVFLVTGSSKASVLRRVLEDRETAAPLPASQIRPANGRLVWYVDRAAASALPSG